MKPTTETINAFGMGVWQNRDAKLQTAEISKQITYDGRPAAITVEIRFDDQCKNGHCTFSVTGEIESLDRRLGDDGFLACGQINDDIAKYFPKLQQFLNWHLVSTDGPMHYLANTLYHARAAGHNGFNAARRSAVWPEATDQQLSLPKDELKALLEARLPALMAEFRVAVESLGFDYDFPAHSRRS